MSIPVNCSKCGAPDYVSDNSAGTTVACKECAAPIDVPGIGDTGVTDVKTGLGPRSQRKRDWGDEDEERRSVAKRKKSGGTGIVLMIVGGVLALFCLMSILVA